MASLSQHALLHRTMLSSQQPTEVGKRRVYERCTKQAQVKIRARSTVCMATLISGAGPLLGLTPTTN